MESLKMKINASKFASLWRREMRLGNHYVIIVTSPCIVYGFCCFSFVTSGAFCMLEITPCLDIDGLKHRVGTSVIYDSWS